MATQRYGVTLLAALQDWQPVLALVGVLFAAAVPFVVTRWRGSGTAKRSEAAELWDAVDEFRKDQQAEMNNLRVRVGALEEQLRAKDQQLQEKDREIWELRQRVWELERQVNGGKSGH